MPNSEANVEFLLRELPDQNGARLFLDRLSNEQPRAYRNLRKQPALVADVLALAAWRPLLATTLEQNPEYFPDRLANEQPRAYRNLRKQPALVADVLALAAWSPLLATTLEQNPEYFPWLARERTDPRVRSLEELKESLARFALTNSSLSPQNLLARFRRRELLRTYLHDIRRSHTLVETMEELSN